MRLVGRPIEVYNYLEPLYNDYRKLRLLSQDGSYSLSYLDEVVDQMLHQDYLFDIALPRLPQRFAPGFAYSIMIYSIDIGLFCNDPQHSQGSLQTVVHTHMQHTAG